MSFNNRLREAREKKGLTQEQFGSLIGAAKSTVSGYEKGVSHPDEEKIVLIMKTLDVDANYLWQDELSSIKDNAPSPISDEEAEKRFIVDMLTDGLSALGFIDDNGQISREDFVFLCSLSSAIFTYFHHGE